MEKKKVILGKFIQLMKQRQYILSFSVFHRDLSIVLFVII